jgi:hypothetical protein
VTHAQQAVIAQAAAAPTPLLLVTGLRTEDEKRAFLKRLE